MLSKENLRCIELLSTWLTKDIRTQVPTPTLPSYALHTLIWKLRSSELPDEAADPSELIDYLLDGNPKTENEVILYASEPEWSPVTHMQPLESVSVVDVMEEIGPSCTGSTKLLTELLQGFPDLAEREISEMLGLISSDHILP